MVEYKLTDRARGDLVDIYDFTENRYGAYQADAYYAGLIRTFGLLADFPRIGQPVDDWPPAICVSAFSPIWSFTPSSLTISKFVPSFMPPRASGPNFRLDVSAYLRRNQPASS
jgi:plasmid stabilization system protein ParE